MIGYESTPTYDTGLRAFHYFPDRSVTEIDAEYNELELRAMALAMSLARDALSDGNPPVGAVLMVDGGEHLFGAKTHDKTSGKVTGHCELVAYDDAFAAGAVKDDLSRSTLVTTAVPCTTCAPPYAETKIGRIVSAAPRRFVFQLAGIMRPRDINMHELLIDGHTDTISVINVGLNQSLGMFALYGKRIGHRLPANIDPYLLQFVEQADAA